MGGRKYSLDVPFDLLVVSETYKNDMSDSKGKGNVY